MKNATLKQRIAGLALAMIVGASALGTLVHAQSAVPAPKPAPLVARLAAQQPAKPAASDPNAKIVSQVSSCLAANSCQVILIDKDKPLVDLRKSASRDMGFDVWEQFVAAP